MSEPMPTIPTQSPFTYPIPNSSASPSVTQDDTFMPNPSASPSFTQDDTFMPEPIQPMPTFTQTAFSQPAVHTQHTHPAQTNPTGQQYPNNVQSQQFQQFQTATISANNAKFPYLEKEKYEIWAMKMEYWIQNADHNLWRIVQQGNSPKRLGKDAKGNTIVHPPVSLDEHVAVQRENKVRTLLLQALPEDHMPDFHHYDDARDIWMADEEMKSIKVNKVWIVIDCPPNAKVVRSKWIFKKKTDMDGKVHTYKARLVAKGCTQTYGIDYEETFSPVADIRAIRILIAIAAYYDYEIWQMDVKTAFLNGRLDEDIYMEQPEGYVDPNYPNGVCKLQRAIYGLKQASRQWNKRFDEEIKKFGFIQNRDEPCVYRKASGSDVVFLILYVDDILIMGNNIPRLKEVKDYLGKCFSVKDLGEAAYILGIKIYRDRSLRLIGLNQSAYIDKILKKFSMQNSKKGFIPMEVKHDLSNEMCASSDEEKAYMKKVPYASAVGSIMYAVRCTRPDVAFAQNLVSRYQQNPGKLHWVAVKHILKYLRNTKDMFLVYGGNPDTELDVTGFCDASWQCDKDDTKSQTGYVFIVNGGAVDWKSKKQTTIAMHATQSEYMAASEAAMEAVWIRKFVGDLGVMPSINKPINMYCDNSAAIIFANEPGVMKGARHFLRRYHYVREQVESGEIKLIKVHTDKNLADAFTKALPRGKVNEHANGIGLRLASSFMHICD
ncbi:retrotransposon protein, putative, ty1-copia subclass [Tanacetum coccineum]